tara:strand:+ start:2553 stop:3182 length:630 start_codon:yes stop_codon:yes gene_type:complete
LIGIFGGTFDPIHKGHVQVIEEVLGKVPLDELLILPNGLPPHKKRSIDEKVKLEMVELALSHLGKLRIDSREILKSSPSYAYETLSELRTEYPDDNLIWIMGVDSFIKIETWFEYGKFLEAINFIILERPGFKIDDESFAGKTYKNKKIARLSESFAGVGKIFFLKINPIEITSTNIRELISKNLDASKFLDPRIHKIINSKGLYKKNS